MVIKLDLRFILESFLFDFKWLFYIVKILIYLIT